MKTRNKIIIAALALVALMSIRLDAKPMPDDAIEGIYSLYYTKFRSDYIVYIVGDSVYTPFSTTLDFFKIYYQSKNLGTRFEGYIGKPNKPFYIDFAKLEAKYQNKIYSFDESYYYQYGAEIYFMPKLLSEVFGFDVYVVPQDLGVFVRSSETLPVLAIEYDRDKENIMDRYAKKYHDLLFDRQRHWINGGIMNYSIAGSRYGVQNYMNYNAEVGMELLGGDLNMKSSGIYSDVNNGFQKQDLFNWRYYIGDNSYLTQVNAGDITNAGIRTSTLPAFNIRGVRISNEETQLPSRFSEYVIDDVIDPGWRVDMEINGVYIAGTTSDASGYYRFELPMDYGTTQIILKFYGPRGEYEEEYINLNVDNEFLKPGEIKYTLSGGERHHTHDLLGDGRISVGLTDWLSTTMGVSKGLDNLTANDYDYFNHTAIRIGNHISSSFDLYYEKLYGGNLRFELSRKLNMSVGYTDYKGYSIFNMSNVDTKLSAGLGISYPFKLPVSFYSNVYRLNYEGYAQTVLTSNATINMNPYYITARYFGNFTEVGDELTLNHFVMPQVAYNWSRKPRWLRFMGPSRFSVFAQYQLNLDQVTRFGATATQNLWKIVSLQGSVSHNMLTDQTEFAANLVFDFPQFRSGSGARKTGNDMIYSTDLSGTVGFDPQNFEFHLSNPYFQSASGFGAAKFQFYLDDNKNDVMDDDEREIEDVKVYVDDASMFRGKGFGRPIAYNLTPYTQFNVSVDKESFKNPLWIPKADEFSFISDPNGYKIIQVPCYVTGVIEGSVTKLEGGKVEGVGGVKVHVASKDSTNNYKEIIPVFSDGSYYKMGVPPGDYVAWVDSAQVEVLGFKQGSLLTFRVEQTRDGDFQSGLDFVLSSESSTRDIAAAATLNEEVDEKVLGEDTTIEKTEPEIEAESSELISEETEIAGLATESTPDETATETPLESSSEENLIDRHAMFVLYFSGTNSTTLSKESREILDQLLVFLKNNSNLKIALVGHSDNSNDLNTNQSLSIERANNTAAYLISKGISKDRIYPTGVGALQPAESNATEEGRSKNRRVEIKILD